MSHAQSLAVDIAGPATPFVDPRTVGRPFPGAQATGLLGFRGNPTRTYYGSGPLPQRPKVLWRVGPFCGPSTDQQGTRTWCGTGWTGQPVVWDRGPRTEVIFGAYDHRVHFLNAENGQPVRPAFKTGDIIKGSVALDPTGEPILYMGSRDNYLRALRLDPTRAVELWKLSSVSGDGVWNNDWDASPLILGDYLFTGSENSWFYVVDLNRGRDLSGAATLSPKVINRIPGFTNTLFQKIGDRMVSIENSATALGGNVYFANSGGLVQGYDMAALISGSSRSDALRFSYFAGDDIDASLVATSNGMLIVAIEDERRPSADKARSGDLLMLDPSKPADPVVWTLDIPGRTGGKGGLWATPALHGNYLYVPTHVGGLLTVEADTGRVTSELPLPWHGWSSPVVIEGQLLVATCEGDLIAYDLVDPAKPTETWRFRPSGAGCWESTPAVWNGVIYFGNRNGFVYAIGESAPADARSILIAEAPLQ
ncbi:outer membrane protein assembly factor BamB family protein [Jannaschia pagri]|nr:PQQ-binding-like beta-propeller repeat protein [Jannaschia sp. AI_62]